MSRGFHGGVIPELNKDKELSQTNNCLGHNMLEARRREILKHVLSNQFPFGTILLG